MSVDGDQQQRKSAHVSAQVSLSGALLEVSHKLAYRGDGWGALSTQIAADLALLDAIMTEDDQEISTGAVNPLPQEIVVPNAGAMLALYRQNLMPHIHESVRHQLSLRRHDGAHLNTLPAPTSEDVKRATERRLRGSSAPVRADALREYAQRMYGAAETLLERRYYQDAFRATYRGDLAVFEAEAIDIAVESGDWSMQTANVRWELACWSLEQLTDLSAIYHNAVVQVRETLDWSLMSVGSRTIQWREMGSVAVAGE